MEITVENVQSRLEQFGYNVQSTDTAAIKFCLDNAVSQIEAAIAQSEIPEQMECAAIDMAVGLFLQQKKMWDTASLADLIDLDGAVASITEGDASVSFNTSGSMTDEQKLDAFISYLLNEAPSMYASFRKLRW